MIGRSVAHYQITEKIGQGGMGEALRVAQCEVGFSKWGGT